MNKGGGKQEIKCGICGKGHLTIKCYKNPNRMQASSAEVGNEAKGGDSDAKNEMQGAQARSDSFQNKGPSIVLVAVEIFHVDAVGKVTHHVVAGTK